MNNAPHNMTSSQSRDSDSPTMHDDRIRWTAWNGSDDRGWTGRANTNTTTSTNLIMSESQVESYLADLQAQHMPIYLPSIILLSLLALTGICGNSLVLAVYGANRVKVKLTATKIFMVAMAASDLAANIISMPGNIYTLTHMWNHRWPVLCRMVGYTSVFTTVMTAVTLVALAFARYRMICHPVGWQVTARQAKIGMGATIAFCSVISVPDCVISGLARVETSHPGIYGSSCAFDDAFDGTPFPNIIHSFYFASFVVLCVPLFVLYALIAVQAYRHRQKHHVRYRHNHLPVHKPTVSTNNTITSDEQKEMNDDNDDDEDDDDDDTISHCKTGRAIAIQDKNSSSEDAAYTATAIESTTEHTPSTDDKTCWTSSSSTDRLQDTTLEEINASLKGERTNLKKEQAKVFSYHYDDNESKLSSTFRSKQSDPDHSKEACSSNNTTNNNNSCTMSTITTEQTTKNPEGKKKKTWEKNSFECAPRNIGNTQNFGSTDTADNFIPCGISSSSDRPGLSRKTFRLGTTGEDWTRIRATDTTTYNNNNNNDNNDNNKSSASNSNALNRTTVMIILITTVYFLGYLPFFILVIYRETSPAGYTAMSPVATAFFHFFFYAIFVNNAANPIIYSQFDPKFRQQVTRLFSCCTKRSKAIVSN